MLKNIKDTYCKFRQLIYSNFNIKVKNVMNTGIKISFIFVLFATLVMAIYITTNPSYILFDIGISLFKSFTMFIAMFLINGIAFNQILKKRN